MVLTDTKAQKLITDCIYEHRETKVILLQDLALIYGVNEETAYKQVKKNPERFGEGFLFELTTDQQKELLEQKSGPHPGVMEQSCYCFSGAGVLAASHILMSPQAVELSRHIVDVTTRIIDMSDFPVIEIKPGMLDEIQNSVDSLSVRCKLILAFVDVLNGDGTMFPGFMPN